MNPRRLDFIAFYRVDLLTNLVLREAWVSFRCLRNHAKHLQQRHSKKEHIHLLACLKISIESCDAYSSWIPNPDSSSVISQIARMLEMENSRWLAL